MTATVPDVDAIALLDFDHVPACEAEVTVGRTRICEQGPATGVFRCSWSCGAAQSWLICDACTAALRGVWAKDTITCPRDPHVQRIRDVGRIDPIP